MFGKTRLTSLPANTIIIQLRRLHSQYTRFCHPSIEIGKSVYAKGEGLICTNDIPMGSILLIENGLYNHHNIAVFKDGQFKDLEEITQSQIKQESQNPDIRAVMDTLTYNKSKIINDCDSDIDIQRFLMNGIQNNIYPLSCKINHGYPTNVSIFSNRSPWHNDIYKENKDKMIVVATDNIPKYSELKYDYFNIVFVNEKSVNAYIETRKNHSDIKMDSNIEQDFIRIDGKHNIYKQEKNGNKINKETLTKIFNEIYLNGVYYGGFFRDEYDIILSKTKRDIMRIFEMDEILYGGLFPQIAESMVDPVIYNKTVQSVMNNELEDDWMDTLCNIYGINPNMFREFRTTTE